MLEIGPVAAGRGLVLAPMRGVNCPSFRLLCKARGADLVSTQTFWSWELDKWAGRLDREFSGEDGPLVVQVGGNQPSELRRAVELLDEHAAIFDFNAGSPHGEPCGHKSGAFLLLHPDQLCRAVSAVIDATGKPVTVKIRAGWDRNRVNVREVTRALCDRGVAAITVHGRTREQLFKGRANWDHVKAAKEVATVPVIGNGDVANGPGAARLLAATGCDGVMIGRAAMGNPFVFTAIRAHLDAGTVVAQGFDDRRADFLSLLESYHRIERDRSLTEVKDHASWFLKGFHGASPVKEQVRAATSISDVAAVLAGCKPLRRRAVDPA